jgi:crotonobetainyl-CoA:carnitine CoA-transferase CaiB-like acyl-CoA transferase
MTIAKSLKVIDLAVGFASAVVSKLMIDNGAMVTRVLPATGDPFSSLYPAYESLKEGAIRGDAALIEDLLASADACIIGGEDYPGLDFGFDGAALLERHPKLIVLELSAYPVGAPSGLAVDLLVQARTGLVHEQLNGQPIQIAMALPSYGVVFAGLLGLWAAIVERDSSGVGQIVRASMQHGVSMFWSQIWMEADHSNALFDKLPPKDVQHLIFECAGGDYIHFVLGVPGALSKLYEVLGIQAVVDPNDRGIPNLERGPDSYFADRGPIAPAIRRWRRDDLTRALNAAGLAAEPVLQPGEAWSDPQVQANGLLADRTDGSTVVGNPLRFETFEAASSGRRELNEPQSSGQAPLAGLKIIDLGNFVAGPYATKLLADLGADVVKIEPHTSLAALTGMRNTWASNRGKRSVVIDMKTPRGLALARGLCAKAHVTSHNFRLGVAERLGVDPASLRRLRADIVTLETNGYGSKGPKAKGAGWDMVMQALCGHEARAGGIGNPPLWYRSALLDFSTGALGAISVLMAVHARNRGAGSVAIESSLLATGLFLMSELIRRSDGSFCGAPLLNSSKSGFHPAERLYRTRDGWIAIAARSEEMASALLGALDIQSITAPRAKWDDAVAELIAARFAIQDTERAMTLLDGAGIWAERCATDGWTALKEASYARSAHLVIDAQDSVYGRIVSTFGPTVTFSRTKVAGPFRSAPHPGEHTREVLASAGVDNAEIDDLIATGIVR